jgi:aspartyl-tRNA(Asn)/glutamyl-tRNA(Gln) amidotransferase subunit B
MFPLSSRDCGFRRGRLQQNAEGSSHRAALSATLRAQSLFALIRKYAQERPRRPFIFSSFRTLYRERKRQPKRSQWLPHSLAHNENITLALSISSALFVRSFAPGRKLTHVFSIISALFRKKVGVGAKIPPSLSRFCALKRLHYMNRASAEQNARVEPRPMPAPPRRAGTVEPSARPEPRARECYNPAFTMTKSAPSATNISPEIAAAYEPVIGLEVHVQLKTATKIFCGCSTRFGDPPNSNTCPVCLGLPGSLPVLNRRALELGVRASLALNLRVQENSRFARKNYFYPDLPKGYQISMYELPLALAGWLEIDHDGARKRIGITRLHLEEDAAKNLHEGFPDSDRSSYIDYNRGGTPLAEIVSEPDLRSPAEAHAYLTALKQVLEYAEVSDCNMEEGSLRCDANVSVRRRGAERFGSKAEVKNLNSFRYLQRALEYEIERQIGVLESGGRVAQETRLWDVGEGCTVAMRSKEFAHDYRYFPDPDLLPVRVQESWLAEIQRQMPELPESRRERFVSAYALSAYDAAVLTATRALADYFEAVVKAGAPAKPAANWISTELLRRLNDSGREIDASPVSPTALADLLRRVEAGSITGASGKKVFAAMFESGKSAETIIAAEGLSQIQDTGEIERLCREVIEKNPDNVAKYRSGNEGVFKFFVGQVIRASRGQANPQLVNETLKRLLS